MIDAIQSGGKSHARTTDDVHRRIVEEAAQVEKGQCLLGETPAIDLVMAAAAEAIQRGMPSNFEYEGRTYWLRFSVFMGMLDVFDSAAARLPLTAGLTGSLEVFGHKPGYVAPHAQDMPAALDESGLVPGQADQVQPVERSCCSDWASLMSKGSRA